MRGNAFLRPRRDEASFMKYIAAVLFLVAAMSAQKAPSTNKVARLDIVGTGGEQ